MFQLLYHFLMTSYHFFRFFKT